MTPHDEREYLMTIGADADCPNCGGDNLTDYPVCQDCAKTCHFPHRASVGKVCIHCQTSGTEKSSVSEKEGR